ncbi:MAG TPA: nucleotidyltransferase family protein [Ilumatobacter sp.]|nr:nucleotidyltransferase family protein [Ilumatobacter sp.]
MGQHTSDEPEDSRTTVALVLAAGAGSRFAGPTHKLLADLNGVPVARRAIDAARRAAIGPVVVVTGAVDLFDGDPPSDVVVVHHAGWADGQATSLQAGLRAARRLGAGAVVVGLADQPFVTAEAWRAVAGSTSPIAVATYSGHRRNPVRLAADVWPLLPTSGDEGARSVVRLRPGLVEEVPCAGSPADIDTWEDLAPWQNRSSTNSR